MRESDIRLELDALLRRRHGHDPDTLIRHEMGLCAGGRRIDVAVLNGEISGFEIKSDEDTLYRLAGQVYDYGLVLDRVTLVTAQRHLDKAVALLPPWWGVIVAQQKRGRVVLKSARRSGRNRDLNPFSLAQFLWRDEGLDLLRARGLARGFSKKPRYIVWLALARHIEVGELRDLVRERIKARQDWPGGRLYALDDETLPIASTG